MANKTSGGKGSTAKPAATRSAPAAKVASGKVKTPATRKAARGK